MVKGERLREEGYYFVKYKEKWEIGYFREDTQSWHVPIPSEFLTMFLDIDFDEVDERRITRKEVSE